MEDLTKIAEEYLGCDRDYKPGASLHTDIQFFKNKDGKLFFRYINTSIDNLANEEEFLSDYQPYNGRMTEQEIIDHPGWALRYEHLAIKERNCTMDLQKIVETQIDKFRAHAGPTERKVEYFECKCCSQLYWRETSHLENGVCTKDSGYEPEIDFSKEEIISNAPKVKGRRVSRYEFR